MSLLRIGFSFFSGRWFGFFGFGFRLELWFFFGLDWFFFGLDLVSLRIGSVISFGLDISKVNISAPLAKSGNTRFYRRTTNVKIHMNHVSF